MKRRTAIIVGTIGCGAVFGVADVLRGSRSMLFGFNRRMQKAYEHIPLGASKDRVIAILGEPRKTTATFCLPQRQGFERYFEAAEKSNAVEYFQWINGMNWYYCIGFDAQGFAVIKGEGHS